MSENKEMKGYKSFDENMKCLGFQYKVGETYHNETAELCQNGFHFCEDPLSVLNYYNQRFAEISANNIQDKTEEDTKRVAKEIKVEKEINLSELIAEGVRYRFSKTNFHKITDDRGVASATGDRGAASATGLRGVASATGDRGAASATGLSGVASATGLSGVASATGWSGAASATGHSGAASATGDRGAASATGWSGVASATGWSGAASATGLRGVASATGLRGAASAGSGSVALSIGVKGRAKGSIGAWIVLAENKRIDDKTSIVDLRCAFVDGKTIKDDTWYSLIDGKFIEQE